MKTGRNSVVKDLSFFKCTCTRKIPFLKQDPHPQIKNQKNKWVEFRFFFLQTQIITDVNYPITKLFLYLGLNLCICMIHKIHERISFIFQTQEILVQKTGWKNMFLTIIRQGENIGMFVGIKITKGC